MSATLAPPPQRPKSHDDAVATQLSTPVKPTIRSATGATVLPVAVARSIAFVALAAWGALHWMSMLEPAEPKRGWTVVGVAILAVAAMLGAGRLPGKWRVVAAVAAIVPLVALMLLAGRVADELLLPGGWGELASGISRGISDLPGVRVPYRGLDDWVRTVIPLGGSALVLVAALLAFWPRRSKLGFPAAALLLLIVLYVVPVVALDFTVEFLRGAVFTLLMVAFLRLEKLRRRDSLAAVALAVVATLVALGAAPILNRDTPWFDYETWAADTSASKSTSFNWDTQTYAGLNWPRDGRELIRVKAKTPAYWKTTNLDMFDGNIWRRTDTPVSVNELPTDNPLALKNWTQKIKVSVRNLRSDQFVTAGFASEIDIPRLETIPTLDGLYIPGRTLRRGDAYTATVYTPKPTERQRRRAGVDYESALANYATIHASLPGVPGASEFDIAFPFFGTKGAPIVYPPRNGTATEVLDRAGLGRIYALALQLSDGAKTPDEYVQRLLDYFSGKEFTYSEVPPRASSTLDGFLFDTKQGYCQQYSGAMALLLRMGGIPARVATGFSTGATDFKTGEYVVRDFDAHAWVEVYYPNWGWLTFDPTPADSPARSQPLDARTTGGNLGNATGSNFGGDPVSERGANVAVTDPAAPWWRIPAIVAGAFALAGLGYLALRRWRRGAPPALSELERALRRTRREPAPGTTLHALELRFANTPAAAGYVRALRENRYRDEPSHPTRAQRRGLRAELGRGGGILGHIRAWWALPPR
ncbi:transglutaminase-like domain-containing protein [Solirubrobacter ginsenosidimutans]|uniref:Transglutaminase-like domain-containing protein n=1 Tax=Solirubrobacter ginsenosidimutans TaxID=490573 RepID=A0A9X3N2E5_9ACTN|nr:transglutaminase domain-containing protein [Solirubrobacter ginsenosidimutans]MDA0163583.1 transglutaminase-like domain-containing protein [Solirubrobacter ginsenosidimutans]